LKSLLAQADDPGPAACVAGLISPHREHGEYWLSEKRAFTPVFVGLCTGMTAKNGSEWLDAQRR
jgi:hypothetical protein